MFQVDHLVSVCASSRQHMPFLVSTSHSGQKIKRSKNNPFCAIIADCFFLFLERLGVIKYDRRKKRLKHLPVEKILKSINPSYQHAHLLNAKMVESCFREVFEHEDEFVSFPVTQWRPSICKAKFVFLRKQ